MSGVVVFIWQRCRYVIHAMKKFLSEQRCCHELLTWSLMMNWQLYALSAPSQVMLHKTENLCSWSLLQTVTCKQMELLRKSYAVASISTRYWHKSGTRVLIWQLGLWALSTLSLCLVLLYHRGYFFCFPISLLRGRQLDHWYLWGVWCCTHMEFIK